MNAIVRSENINQFSIFLSSLMDDWATSTKIHLMTKHPVDYTYKISQYPLITFQTPNLPTDKIILQTKSYRAA